MPSIEKIKSVISQVWDILKVLSVLFLMTSTVISTLVWFGVNIFYPNSIAIEITKYFMLVLVPTTISAIILQAYQKNIEKKINALRQETDKVEPLKASVESLSQTVEEHTKNLQYFNNIFAIQCPNPNCRKWISIPIPSSIVKEIHLVDGRPTGKFLKGREMQIKCEACEEVYHIVYP